MEKQTFKKSGKVIVLCLGSAVRRQVSTEVVHTYLGKKAYSLTITRQSEKAEVVRIGISNQGS